MSKRKGAGERELLFDRDPVLSVNTRNVKGMQTSI